jgi:mannan endo-1,4-beta-mannosidase
MKNKFLLKQGLTIFCALIYISFLASCSKSSSITPQPPVPIDTVIVAAPPSLATVKSWLTDKNVTDETASLFYNMKKTAKTNVMFGQQYVTEQGNQNGQAWQATLGAANTQSDIKSVTGVYPSIYGHDFMFITDFNKGQWFQDQANMIHDLTVQAYVRGGINTFSWHCENQVSRSSFYWGTSTVECVPEILPGGAYNKTFDSSLQVVAAFAKSLVSNGVTVPIIFRPWHEADGNWFWWGTGHCSPTQYKQLYQYTVSYLRDTMAVHNFLYEWSPGGYTNETSMLSLYPGDDYVDILGCDDYYYSNTVNSSIIQPLKVISDYAVAHNKIAAFSETGLDNLTTSNWYTQNLLAVLKSPNLKLAYSMVWDDSPSDFYVPYPGHPAANDFLTFKNDPFMIFADKLPDMYHIK